jgi:hypothetical protein
MASTLLGPIGPGLSPTPAFATASGGMQTAEGRADADAASIATAGPDVGSMVDLDVQSVTYGALADVVRTTDEMTRSAIDLLA